MRKKTRSGNRGTVGRRDEVMHASYYREAGCYDEVNKEDYLIILGDVGVCRDGGVGESVVQELLGL